MFKEFTARTGIRVQYVEGGSGVVVNRIMAERSNPQADVLVTLPPFIQEAAGAGLLAPYAPPAKSDIPIDTRSKRDLWYPLVNNFSCWIYNSKLLSVAPASYQALLAPTFKNRLQYSTPGEAGDGTAVMLMSFKIFGGTSEGFDYLKQLQANNLGPSSSTGRLAALVNKGELLVANGDVQMNYAQMTQYPNIKITFPTGPDGKRIAMALPYDIGLVKRRASQQGRPGIDCVLTQQVGAGSGLQSGRGLSGPSRYSCHRKDRRRTQEADEWCHDMDA
jgi:ABC-type Fe3+ transport system, periplasmic component